MELRQLKTFLVVAQLLNFNRAAEVLNYAQSTVSAQIKALEDDFSVSLFDRLGKRVILTEAGQMLVRYAQKMLDVEKETMASISGWEEARGSISLRIPQSIATFYLPDIIDRFHSKHAGVNFDVSSCALYSLQQELQAGIVDVAFLLAESVDASDLTTELLKIEPLVFVSGPTHPLSRFASIGIKQIAASTLLLPKHDCSYKMTLQNMLTAEKVDPNVLMEFNSVETIKNCVKKGIGITLTPKFAVEKEILSGQLIALPWCEGDLETAVIMIRHRDKWMSPTLNAFMDTVRAVFTVQEENT